MEVSVKTILIIEDDTDINNMLSKLLVQNGYNTISAYSGTEGILVHNENVNLILLDMMLPGKSGEEIIEDLKEKHDIPVIVISAVIDVDKKVKMLMKGADDYITKPFSNKELLARIAVRLRNDNLTNKDDKRKNEISFMDIVIDKDNFTASCNGMDLDLSKYEFLLLQLLVENSSRTCTKSMIYEAVWNYDDSGDDNTLNVHISKLRKRLKECNPENDYIETVWGIGYRMKR